jgi:hypothetical protein
MSQTKAYQDAAGFIHLASERNREWFQRAQCGLRSRLLRQVDRPSLNDMCEECRDVRASVRQHLAEPNKTARKLAVIRDAERRGRAHRESLIAKGIVRPNGERR